MNPTQRESVAPTMLDTRAALLQRSMAPRCIYADSEDRLRMRALLTGAALAGAQVRLSFFKVEGFTLRYMLCTRCPGADATARYMTVRDDELSQEAGRTVYRRVCLDTIAKVLVEFAAGDRPR